MSPNDSHLAAGKLCGEPARMATRAIAAGAAAVLLPLFGTTPAFADIDNVGSVDALAEVVVQGEKMESNLQKAPESITAVSNEAMQQSHIVTPLDLNGQVPALVITTSEGYDRSVAIRGIGFNVPQDDSAQPSVSYHENGIYIANQVALNSGFLDVDHVEVLRGPQGTVFGQNAIGGTINVIENIPSLDAIKGYADLSTGSWDLVHTDAAVNIPLGSQFAIRGAFDQNYQHGNVLATDVYGTNGDYDLNNQNNFHTRLQGLWQPLEVLSIVLRAEYAQANQHEVQAKNIHDPDPYPWEETSDWPGRFVYDEKLGAATITYDMGFATIKSLTSWQAVDQGTSVSEDGLTLELAQPFHDVEWFYHDSRSVTSELDLASKPGGKFDWIIGSFLLANRLAVAYDQYSVVPGQDYTPDALGLVTPTPALINAIYDGDLYFEDIGLEHRDSYSFYGSSTYHFTDALRLTAGLRYTFDHNTTFFRDLYNLYGSPISVGQTAVRFTWKGEAEYDLTPSNLLYASVSTGFKPGGGNISQAPAVVPFQFQPETILAYEIGLKNSFLDKHITANLAAFYYIDRNMQYQAEDLINFQGGVDNIPETQIYGFEAEFQALLPYNLHFDLNATVEDSHITSHFLALDNDSGNAANQQFISLYGLNAFLAVETTGSPALNALRLTAYRDVYGNPAPMLPRITGAANLSHSLRFADGSTLLSHIGVQWRSDYADTIFGKTPTYTAPGYGLANVYFDYTFPSKTWDASLAVTNLFNNPAVLSRFTNQYGGETTQEYFPQREFVAHVGYKF
jgi:iron complex outermembrane recepter protein